MDDLDLTRLEQTIGCAIRDALPSLTKRELFAAMAMQGMLANSSLKPSLPYARTALTAADCLLAALAEEGSDAEA